MTKLPRFNRDPSRKKAKRPPAKPAKIDPDLVQLAQMLDEHRLEKNAKGWFELPWRDGENAVRLALEVYFKLSEEAHEIPTTLSNIAADLHNTSFGMRHTLAYEALEAYRYTMPVSHFLSAPVRAALRCRQLKIANSHGGGHVYNEVLTLGLFETVTEESVIHWRAHDALMRNAYDFDDDGASIITQTERSQEWQRAKKMFELAWKRGLYHAAYAIKPVGG